ncbi:hypothetical protein N7490_003190 [Penicillium lividum]|nr:hypothetical protein N7490_003190 [Penicillium lividum]
MSDYNRGAGYPRENLLLRGRRSAGEAHMRGTYLVNSLAISASWHVPAGLMGNVFKRRTNQISV